MKSHFLEIPLSLIYEDARYPNLNKSVIYEHLLYTYTHYSPYPLPTIDVVFLDRRFVVIAGHYYLRIAKERGEPWIRAILKSESTDTVELLKKLPLGIRITPKEVFERELAVQVEREFHTYFFEEPMGPEARKRFLFDIAGFFERLETPLIAPAEKRLFQSAFPFEGRCAEFEALIPKGDYSWAPDYLRISREFSRNVQRIVSFQGLRFPE